MASKRETQKLSIGKAKASIQRPRPDTVIRKGLAEVLPTSVQKTYFTLSDPVRNVLNTALEKYRPSQSEPILVGGENLLKPALRLMTRYRLVIEEIKDAEVITNHTRWVDAVQVRGARPPIVNQRHEILPLNLTFEPQHFRAFTSPRAYVLCVVITRFE